MAPLTKKQIGKNLQAARKRAGYRTAEQYVLEKGGSLSTYRNYEQGARTLTADLIWEFADDFGCSCDELIGRIPPNASQASRGNAASENLERDEGELLLNYRACGSTRRAILLSTSRDFAAQEKKPSEGEKVPRAERRSA